MNRSQMALCIMNTEIEFNLSKSDCWLADTLLSWQYIFGRIKIYQLLGCFVVDVWFGRHGQGRNFHFMAYILYKKSYIFKTHKFKVCNGWTEIRIRWLWYCEIVFILVEEIFWVTLKLKTFGQATFDWLFWLTVYLQVNEYFATRRGEETDILENWKTWCW